jgi:imidazoleglycerol-phosphate dehydratase
MNRGGNGHHVIEAIFKGTARAVRAAVELDPRSDAIPSTKGTLTA